MEENANDRIVAKIPMMQRMTDALVKLSDALSPILVGLGGLLALAFFVVVVTTPLDVEEQILFGTIIFLFALLISKLPKSRLYILMLICMSTVVSCRYLYWRITETLDFDHWLDAFFGYGLFLAELYAILTALLSYLQSAWPLERKPSLMVGELSQWPTVDVYIPTYNEPESVVRQTILAAKLIDWPRQKLNIYVLDDGRRETMRELCEKTRVNYITRSDNKHAKAGNINHAMTQTDGEFIVIFDCDHVPTRSFLQISIGWFLKDKKLGMLQTPHVFFSPDPMEHNLDVFHAVPNEGQLFYGLTQDGNDLWNAAFFCGSCAVLRREHLLQIGGMATESVTEDALTALKMNSAGLNTAYLAIPLAAGLATETLSRHVGQRIRWARGMAQIMSRFNPLTLKGLTLSQRLCYFSAALHFFYGLPRIVFLTAPLAYLFFGAHVFQAAPLAILAYALPHIAHAYLTNLQLQGKFRHAFWNEVYETVLAWYLMRPTLATLIKPDGASFNVTVKGGTKEVDYFDWVLARPYIVLLLLNCAGLLLGPWFFLAEEAGEGFALTLALNAGWTVHNIVICGASIAVAGEQRQLREAPRVLFKSPATLTLQSGHRYACQTSDFSTDGVGLFMGSPVDLNHGEQVHVSLYHDDEEVVLPAIVRFTHGTKVGLEFADLTTEESLAFTQVTFGRADMWTTQWFDTKPSTPSQTFVQIGRISARGVSLLVRESAAVIASKMGLGRKQQPI